MILLSSIERIDKLVELLNLKVIQLPNYTAFTSPLLIFYSFSELLAS
nr:MAG TPA: hypothetical protein [Bacteriophage sp.]